MMLVVLVAVVAAAASANEATTESNESGCDVHCAWRHFQSHYNKGYADEATRSGRFAQFQRNWEGVLAHNARAKAGYATYEQGINRFSDMTEQEVRAQVAGAKWGVATPVGLDAITETRVVSEPPASIDWREKGAVTAVKNQGTCGSCWIFSAVGAIEGAYQIKTKKLFNVSEQQVLACQAKGSCIGGVPYVTYIYAKNNTLCTAEEYPYHPPSDKPFPPPPPVVCKIPSNCSTPAVPKGAIMGYVFVPKNNATAMMEALALGPVSIVVDAGPLINYRSGILSGNCASAQQTDHAILAVGYGTEGGKDYWIVKNSWGGRWGEEGYARLARHDKECAGYGTGEIGLLSGATYPLI